MTVLLCSASATKVGLPSQSGRQRVENSAVHENTPPTNNTATNNANITHTVTHHTPTPRATVSMPVSTHTYNSNHAHTRRHHQHHSPLHHSHIVQLLVVVLVVPPTRIQVSSDARISKRLIHSTSSTISSRVHRDGVSLATSSVAHRSTTISFWPAFSK